MTAFRNLIFWTLLLTSASAKGQSSEAAMYEKAYHYLNDSILSRDFVSSQELEKNCAAHVKIIGGKLSFASELQVAHRFIKLNSQFPLGDLAKKNYDLSDDCQRDLRMGVGKCETVNQMMDSLNTFWNDYKMLAESEILRKLKGLPSKKKDGYQVFFSDIYQNTLAAELKDFCLPYDSNAAWTDASLSFYFVFDENDEIKTVYSERRIHYN